jgi:RNA polymerase sigma factor (sigma-70 family)
VTWPPTTTAIERLLQEAKALRALARCLVAPADVDDVLQDTWVAALQRPPDATRPARPWLSRIVRNLASNRRRDDQRRQAREAAHAGAHAGAGTADPADAAALAQAAELHRRLAVAIERLPEPLRAVIVLCYFHGLDSRAAGDQLGLPATTVRTRHQRALEELREALDTDDPGGRAAWTAAVHALLRTTPAPAATAAGGIGALAAAAALTAATVFAFVASWPGTEAGIATGPANVGADRMRVAGAPARDDAVPRREQPATGRSDAARARSEDTARSEAAAAAPGGLEGQLLIDGAPPAFDVLVRLVADADARSVAAPEPPSGARPRLQPLRELLLPAGDGHFRFDGLPAGWRGALFADGCEGLDGAAAVPVQVPSRGTTLHVRSGPRITGRLAAADGGPLDFAGLCELRTSGADGAQATEVVPFRCRADGAFAIPLRPRGERVTAVLRVEVDGRGFLHHEVPPCDRRRGADTGLLGLEPVRGLALRVVDAEGRALADATATIAGDTEAARAVRADADGTCHVAFAPRRAVTLRIAAPGHAARSVAAPPDGVATMALDPIVGLTVRIPAPLLATTAHVRLTAAQPVFVDGAAPALEGAKVVEGTAGARRPDEAGAGALFAWTFTPGAAGDLHITDLRPHTAFTVEAVDAAGRVLARRDVLLPARGSADVVLASR